MKKYIAVIAVAALLLVLPQYQVKASVFSDFQNGLSSAGNILSYLESFFGLSSDQTAAVGALLSPTINLSATPTTSGISLSWNQVPGATGYHIHWSATHGPTIAPSPQDFDLTATTTYLDTSVPNSWEVDYVVTAKGVSASSAPVHVQALSNQTKSTNSSCINFTTNLKSGSTDANSNGQVTILKNFLRTKGYSSYMGNDGNFGSGTEKALSAFQKSVHLPVTGVLDQVTRAYFAAIQMGTCGTPTPPSILLPTINSLTPSSGPINTSVTIGGTGLTADSVVVFGGHSIGKGTLSSQGLTFTIPSTLTASCPSGQMCPQYAISTTPGVYTVIVSNTNGGSNTSNFTVTTSTQTQAGSPTITSVAALASDNSQVYAGERFGIDGTNFSAPDSVYLGNQLVTVTQDSSPGNAGLIYAMAPANLTAGSSYVYVKNSNGTSNSYPVTIYVTSGNSTNNGCVPGAVFSSITGAPCSITPGSVSLSQAAGINAGTQGYEVDITATGGTTARPVKNWNLNFVCSSTVDINTVPGDACGNFQMGTVTNNGNIVGKQFFFKNSDTKNATVPVTATAYDAANAVIGTATMSITVPSTQSGPLSFSQVTLLTPNGGQTFSAGQTISVTWKTTPGTFTFSNGSKTDIKLLNGNVMVADFDNLTNTGSASITIPSSVSPGSNYNLFVTVYADGYTGTPYAGSAGGDGNDTPFTITSTSITQISATLTSPSQTTDTKPTLSGTANGTNQISLLIKNANGTTVDAEKPISVTNNIWSYTEIQALPVGTYTVYVQDANGNTLISASLTISTPAPVVTPTSNLTFMSGSATTVATNQNGQTAVISGTFMVKVHPQPGSMVHPQASDFQVKVGTSLANSQVVPSSAVGIYGFSPVPSSSTLSLPANSDTTFNVAATINASTLPTSGQYFFYLTSALTAVNDLNSNPISSTLTGAPLSLFVAGPVSVTR